MTLANRADLSSNLLANEREREVDGYVDPIMGRKVASIDVVHIGKWLDEAGIPWRVFWQQWTNQERRRWLAKRVNTREFWKLKTADRNI